ncbi:hypothetical protein R6Q59_034086 [Mikania micrantha]
MVIMVLSNEIQTCWFNKTKKYEVRFLRGKTSRLLFLLQVEIKVLNTSMDSMKKKHLLELGFSIIQIMLKKSISWNQNQIQYIRICHKKPIKIDINVERR